MAVPKDLPEQWSDGARSAVEPFLASFFGIELSETWCFLVDHRELAELPASSYNPLPDADQHAKRHVTRSCKSCSIWRVLKLLWTTTARLYEGRMRHALYWETLRLLKRLRARIGALERDGPRPGDRWLMKLKENERSLDDLAQLALEPLDPDTRAVVVTRRRDPMLRRVCRLLHSGGFSYVEIARLIGDRLPNAAQRVRQRCKLRRKRDGGG